MKPTAFAILGLFVVACVAERPAESPQSPTLDVRAGQPVAETYEQCRARATATGMMTVIGQEYSGMVYRVGNPRRPVAICAHRHRSDDAARACVGRKMRAVVRAERNSAASPVE